MCQSHKTKGEEGRERERGSVYLSVLEGEKEWESGNFSVETHTIFVPLGISCFFSKSKILKKKLISIVKDKRQRTPKGFKTFTTPLRVFSVVLAVAKTC